MEAARVNQHPAKRGGLTRRLGELFTAPGVAGWLLVLLLVCCAYAAFANGAISVPEETRVQAGLAAALVLAGIGAGAMALGAGRSRCAWAAVCALTLFALWSALSVSWSIAPDVGWLASNRAIAYAIAVAIALLCAPAVRGAPAAFAVGFVLVTFAVALYALGGKIAPQLSVGPVDLGHASHFSRLRAPLGYWNGLGLLLVMATPVCVWLAASPRVHGALRLSSLLVLEILITTVALTYSRGALIAYAVALAAMVVGGPSRLRRLAAGGLTPLFSVAPVVFAISRPDLADDGVAAAQRADDGLLLGLILLGSLLTLAGVAWFAGLVERRSRWTPRKSRIAWRAIAVAGVVTVAVGIGMLARSDQGLTETVSDQWSSFRQAQEVTNDPDRLLSSNSSNRWTWWSEALGAFSDKPVTGWGAGAFPIVHYLYRDSFTQVRSAHSAPLQFLAEGGVVGAVLGLGGVGLLIAAAVAGVRRAQGGERDSRLPLLAAGCAWAIHCFYDWGWEIPAVTLPALIGLAIAASPYGPLSSLGKSRNRAVPLPGGALLSGTVALVAATVLVSAALPALSQSKRLDAVVATGSVQQAAADAALAHKLNPVSVEPLLASSNIAIRRGDFAAAAGFLVEAARLQPDGEGAWDALLGLQQRTGDTRELTLILSKIAQANPQKASAVAILATQITAAGAASSPTAYGTPPVTSPTASGGGGAG